MAVCKCQTKRGLIYGRQLRTYFTCGCLNDKGLQTIIIIIPHTHKWFQFQCVAVTVWTAGGNRVNVRQSAERWCFSPVMNVHSVRLSYCLMFIAWLLYCPVVRMFDSTGERCRNPSVGIPIGLLERKPAEPSPLLCNGTWMKQCHSFTLERPLNDFIMNNISINCLAVYIQSPKKRKLIVFILLIVGIFPHL